MTSINEEAKSKIIEALNALALALAGHDHQWTDKQRDLYEKAIRILT